MVEYKDIIFVEVPYWSRDFVVGNYNNSYYLSYWASPDNKIFTYHSIPVNCSIIYKGTTFLSETQWLSLVPELDPNKKYVILHKISSR